MKLACCAGRAQRCVRVGAGAAGATITVTHELDAARPAAIVAVPFARDRQRWRPTCACTTSWCAIRRAARCRSQITNYQHDHRGAPYDDLVFPYDFAAGEKRADVHARARGHRHAARSALRLRAHGARALRRHGLGKRPHRAPHVRPRAQLAAPPAASGCAAAASTSGRKRVTLPDRRSLVRQGSRPVPQGRGRRRPRPLQHRRLARRRRHGRVGRHASSGPPTTSSTRRCCRTARGARHSSSPTRPGMRAARGKVSETKQFTVDCGPQFRCGRERVRFRAATKPSSASASPNIRRRQDFPRPCSRSDPDGRWMSFWEENKDGGLGVAVILASDATPAGFAHEDAPGGKARQRQQPAAGEGEGRRAAALFHGRGLDEERAVRRTARPGRSYVKELAARARKPLTVTVSART